MKKALRRTIMIGGAALLMSVSGGILMAQEAPEGPAPSDQAQQQPAPTAVQTQPARPDQPPAPGPGGPGGPMGMRGFDPARIQQMILDHIKGELKASDDEWAAMEPQVKEINTLRMKVAGSQMGGMRSMFRGMRRGGDQNRPGGGPGAGGPGGMFRQENPELNALTDAVDNEGTTNKDLQAKLKALRDSNKKNEDALKAAREQLRKLVTVRQEAVLVINGVLD